VLQVTGVSIRVADFVFDLKVVTFVHLVNGKATVCAHPTVDRTTVKEMGVVERQFDFHFLSHLFLHIQFQ
jgi:hypothetical protein